MEGTSSTRSPALIDGYSREISYLRLSVTDRCNYRCTYCAPRQGIQFRRRSELLTFEEIGLLLRIFAGLGIRRVRLTGGEPTVRAGIVELVRQIASVPREAGEGCGSRAFAVLMTTNAQGLSSLAEPLARAGLSGINVSLDTLEPKKFRELTQRGKLSAVIAGVRAAVAAGIEVKLNAVAMKGVNDAELAALCVHAWELGALPRFIEHMPMSGGSLYSIERRVTAAEIRQTVEQALGISLLPTPAKAGSGPARYWQVADAPHQKIGIISAMSEQFCDACNRLRLSAVGELQACLGFDDSVSLRDVLRSGGSPAEVEQAIRRAVAAKRAGHQFLNAGAGAPRSDMIGVGG